VGGVGGVGKAENIRSIPWKGNGTTISGRDGARQQVVPTTCRRSRQNRQALAPMLGDRCHRHTTAEAVLHIRAWWSAWPLMRRSATSPLTLPLLVGICLMFWTPWLESVRGGRYGYTYVHVTHVPQCHTRMCSIKSSGTQGFIQAGRPMPTVEW